MWVYELQSWPDEWDSFHVEVRDPERVVSALVADAARHGRVRVPPESQIAFGRWIDGEEEPRVERHLVSPAAPRWTTVLSSVIDWHLERSARLAAGLGCRAAYLQLSDGDVFSLHLFDGPAYVAGYQSSPCYFDLPAREPSDLGVDLDAVLAFCREGTTREELAAALAPPGRLDVDGQQAFLRTAALLGLPDSAAASYREALDANGLSVAETHAAFSHHVFREPLEDASEEGPVAVPEAAADTPHDNVVPFRQRKG